MTTDRTVRPAAPKTPKPKRRKDGKTPRPPKAQPGSGYWDLVALARNSGQVVSINAQAVRRNDHFEYAYGLNERLEHVPATGDRGEITHFYAYVKLKDGGHHFDVMSRAEMDAVRDRSQDSAWVSGYAEMGKTAVLRRIARFLPLAGLREKGMLASLDGFGEIVGDSPAAPSVPVEPRKMPSPEIEPEGVELTEEEFFALLPPLHIIHILDAVAEREMPEKVLEEIVGKPLDEVTEEEEAEILRAIALWQPDR